VELEFHMSKAIIFEGIPGAGKTTLMNSISSELNLEGIPEILATRKEWDFARSTEDQDFFWENDIKKMYLAKNSLKTTLMDRGYVSTLAYNYAKVVLSGCGSYSYLFYKYKKDILDNNLKADFYIFIDIPIQLSFLRKQRTIKKNDPWQDPVYLNEIRKFYRFFLEDIEGNVPILKLDGTCPLLKNVKEVQSKILSLI